MKIFKRLTVKPLPERLKFSDYGKIIKKGISTQKDKTVTEGYQLLISGRKMLFNGKPYFNSSSITLPTEKDYLFHFSVSANGAIRLDEIEEMKEDTPKPINSHVGMLSSGVVKSDVRTEVKIDNTIFSIRSNFFEEDLQPGEEFQLEPAKKVYIRFRFGGNKIPKLIPYIDEDGREFHGNYIPRLGINKLNFIEEDEIEDDITEEQVVGIPRD